MSEVFVFIPDQGEEAFESITEFANRENITGAAVSAIGAFSQAKIGWFEFVAKTFKPIEVWIGAANARGDNHGNRGSSAPQEAAGSRYRADQHLVVGGKMYALFEGERQIGNPFATEEELWEAALIEGLVTDVPVADEEGGQLLPAGYHVKQVNEGAHPRGVKRRS